MYLDFDEQLYDDKMEINNDFDLDNWIKAYILGILWKNDCYDILKDNGCDNLQYLIKKYGTMVDELAMGVILESDIFKREKENLELLVKVYKEEK